MTLETASLSLEGIGDGNFGRGLGIARGYIGDEETIAPMINRDLSLVEFFWRVLEEAIDSEQPLLERIKFMGILSTLFDEFFMIRVSGLKVKAERLMEVTPDGLTAAEQVTRIRERLLEMIDLQYKCYHSELLPALKTEEIRIASYSSLSSAERASLDDFFKQNIFPVLTPQAVDLSHPFPYISGLCLNIALTATPTLHKRSTRAMSPDRHEFFIRMKIPQFLPRLVPLKGEDSKFVWVEDLIASNIREIIPEADSAACHFFRITRDADIEVHESEAHDLLEAMEENLKLRRFGEVVRLEVSRSMPDSMRDLLITQLNLRNEDVYVVDGPINLGDLSSITKLNRPELKEKPFRVIRPEILAYDRSFFDVIKEGDVLLHHPYMPYSIVTDLIAEAAEDPDVLAIKICLYRMGPESPIPPLLIKASEMGKQVTVLIEIKARFDEENNIEWAKKLERTGVHVIYGLPGLKTHAKTTLIVRREGDRLRRYVHAATGNYNPQTSAVYTDLGLLTVDEEICEDVTRLFNFITVYSRHRNYKKLLVAPENLRARMLELINREAEHARRGQPAAIIAKLNRLADAEIANALYDASKAGVKIDMIIRGICTLRPGVPGLSENIRVRSVVGRLLEHSRVYYFENGGDEEVFMGSADWMPRNLDRRVEVLSPITSEPIKRYLIDEYLDVYLRDNTKARLLNPNGRYERIERSRDEPLVNAQEELQRTFGPANL